MTSTVMRKRTGDHAVVLGASMAGLLAARVLTETYRKVTLIDRTSCPDRSAPPRRAARPSSACRANPRT
jgi:2-polyprenyl-6-methoxyphenol hydroxylase-like FAD-dependent oxidoreductase